MYPAAPPPLAWPWGRALLKAGTQEAATQGLFDKSIKAVAEEGAVGGGGARQKGKFLYFIILSGIQAPPPALSRPWEGVVRKWRRNDLSSASLCHQAALVGPGTVLTRGVALRGWILFLASTRLDCHCGAPRRWPIPPFPGLASQGAQESHATLRTVRPVSWADQSARREGGGGSLPELTAGQTDRKHLLSDPSLYPMPRDVPTGWCAARSGVGAPGLPSHHHPAWQGWLCADVRRLLAPALARGLYFPNSAQCRGTGIGVSSPPDPLPPLVPLTPSLPPPSVAFITARRREGAIPAHGLPRNPQGREAAPSSRAKAQASG